MSSYGEPGSSSDGLFRDEVLSASRERIGSPVQWSRLTSWALTAFLLALFAGVGTFLALGSYTRRETVSGVLAPTAGASRAAPLRSGVVTQVFVTEGELVEAGEPLFAVSTETTVGGSAGQPAAALGDLTARASASEIQAVRSGLRAQRLVQTQRAAEIESRLGAAGDEMASVSASLEFQKERERLAQESLRAGLVLNEQGLFPTVQLRQREEAVLAAKQGRVNLERELARGRATRAQLAIEAQKARGEVAMIEADASRTLAQLSERQATNKAGAGSLITAQRPGRVTALQVRPGSIAQAGVPGAIILPEGEVLEAELWAPSRAVGFVRPGAEVRLMYDSFPYEKFGVGHGVVRSVARAPTTPADSNPAQPPAEPLYRIIVSLQKQEVSAFGRAWPLSPGMRLRADLVLEKRNFWAWLTSPVAAVAKRS